MNMFSTPILIRQQREQIDQQYRHKNEMLALEGKQLVYDNQKLAAAEACLAFLEGAVAVILIAQPGVGKTGVGLEVMRIFGQHPDDNFIIPASNIYQITGMSDCDWKDQLENNVLDIFKKNIHHRGTIMKHEQELSSLKNGLLICDECHIASGKDMTLSKTLKNAGLFDIDALRMRNVKLLDISATPETISEDYKKWGSNVKVVILKPSDDYKGFQVMKDEKRLKRAPSLEKYEDTIGLLRFFELRYANSTKKYFPFRVPTKGNARSNLIRASLELGWNTPIIHDSNDRIDEMDKRMEKAPEKHTIIFIKGFWRASKRIKDKHVGGSYETIPKKQDTTSTSQGLAARFCSTYKYSGDQLNPDLRPIHFCDDKAIDQYLDWIKNGCDYAKSEYSSQRIKSSNGKVIAKPSKVHHTNVKGIEVSDSDSTTSETNTPSDYRIFRDYTKAVGWLAKFGLKTRFQNRPNGKDEYEGRYVCNLSSNKQRPNFLTEAVHKSGYKGGGKSSKRAIPVYLDAKNKDSQVLWFVFVPNRNEKPDNYDTNLSNADFEFPDERNTWIPQAANYK